MNYRLVHIGSLKDPEKTPQYVCPVCGNTGLCTDPAERKWSDMPEICKFCGYEWGANRDKEKWNTAWLATGGKPLFENPYKQRSECFNQIALEYMRRTCFMPSEDEIKNLKFDDRLFAQYGFIHVTDRKKKLIVEHKELQEKHDFETNTVIKINNAGAYVALCIDDDFPILFVSDFFSHDSSSSEQLRAFYFALNSDVFSGGIYDLRKDCSIKGADGIMYKFRIE